MSRIKGLYPFAWWGRTTTQGVTKHSHQRAPSRISSIIMFFTSFFNPLLPLPCFLVGHFNDLIIILQMFPVHLFTYHCGIKSSLRVSISSSYYFSLVSGGIFWMPLAPLLVCTVNSFSGTASARKCSSASLHGVDSDELARCSTKAAIAVSSVICTLVNKSRLPFKERSREEWGQSLFSYKVKQSTSLSALLSDSIDLILTLHSLRCSICADGGWVYSLDSLTYGWMGHNKT